MNMCSKLFFSCIPSGNAYRLASMLLVTAALMASALRAQALPTLPLDFESAGVNYTFTNFDGGACSKVANPFSGGINTSANVGKMVKGPGQTWGGSWISTAAPIDFSTNKLFKAKVYVPRANVKMLLKVENATNPAVNFEKEVTIATPNSWQEITFDYTSIDVSKQYQHIVIIFDNGTMGDSSANFTFYFDDLRLASGGSTLTQMNLPVTFDAANVDYGLVGFGGAENSTIAADPQNAANKTGKVVKTATAELWAGTTITAVSGGTQTGFSARIPFTASEKRMNVRVFSPHAPIQVRLKVEDYTDPAKSVETEATITVANSWQTLTFDFGNQASGTSPINLAYNYNKATIFFNFGVTGATAGEKTYYFDDVKFGEGVVTLSQMDLPVTFDNPAIEYGLVGFGGAENSTIVTETGVPSNKVGKVVKTATAELWAGTTITAVTGGTQTGFATRIPFTASEKRMNLRVFSSHAPIQVRLKVEDYQDPTKSVETEATLTTANSWQTLTFDFGNQATGTQPINLAYNYNKASIFFNFGVTGATAGEKTYFFDDVKFGAPGSTVINPSLPLDFETAGVSYDFTNFDGGNCRKIANPVSGGSNTSPNVAKMVKGPGQTWGGSFITLASPIDFSVNKVFKVKAYLPRVGAKLLLKVENATNPAVNFEKEVTGTVANAWNELTFDFSTIDATKQYQNLVFIFDNGTAGDSSANFTYYFDDVRLVAGGTLLTQMDLPVTFDVATVNYGLVGFGGAENSTIVADPLSATNKVAKTVKTATAELWAGVTVTAVTGGTQTGFANRIPFTASEKRMNLKVYSPHAPIQVRLKVEDYQDPAKSVETEATVTVANTWQTLTFDFGNQAAGTAPINLAYNYNKASVFYNFGVTGATAGERTYYCDDMRFGAATGVTESGNSPVSFALLQNYPNPFNPSTTIAFTLPQPSNVTLSIFNQLGQQMDVLVNDKYEAGTHSVIWNAAQYPSGVYYCRITSGAFSDVRKISLIK